MYSIGVRNPVSLAVSAAGGGRLTETGLSLGTPHYMSPEQATGDQHVGPATDTYALGAVLYEMLVGQPPYTGSSAQAILGKIISGKLVPATQERPAVPAHVDSALRRALETLPADRFTSMRDFVKAVGDEHFRYGEAVAGVGGMRGGTWNRLTVAMSVVAATSTLALGWSMLRPEPLPPVSRQIFVVEGGALERAVANTIALAPDGSSMILPLGSFGTGDARLGLKVRGSTEVTPISGTDLALSVTYSPDSQSIAYVVGRDIFKQRLVGGAPVRLAGDAYSRPSGPSPVEWLDDGTILYSQTPPTLEPGRAVSRLLQISEDGGDSRVIIWPETGPALPGRTAASPGRCTGPHPRHSLQ